MLCTSDNTYPAGREARVPFLRTQAYEHTATPVCDIRNIQRWLDKFATTEAGPTLVNANQPDTGLHWAAW